MLKILSKRYVCYITTLLNLRENLVATLNTDLYIDVRSKKLAAYLYFFKDHTLMQFKQLVEIAVVDRPYLERRF
jgi:hypothetical protein